MFTDDYIMRQIEMLSRSIAKIVFDKDNNTVDLIREDDIGGSLSEKEEGMLSKIQNLISTARKTICTICWRRG